MTFLDGDLRLKYFFSEKILSSKKTLNKCYFYHPIPVNFKKNSKCFKL